jgi:dephospho-CoA kinase
MRIIGVAGTNGAGKDSVGEYLADKHGWHFVSGSDILRDELRRRGLPIEREHLRGLSTEWRRNNHAGYLIEKAVEGFEEGKYSGLVIASIRHPGEADYIHEHGGQIIWIDADPKIRYKRIYSRQRSSEDNKTYEQFLAEEKDEMEHSGDHHSLSLSAVKAKADLFIENNSDDIDRFYEDLDKALKLA